MSALADHGIHIRNPKVGWQGTACPECAKHKRRPHDDSLGVEIFADGGARWSCQRCGWKGHILSRDRDTLCRRPSGPGRVIEASRSRSVPDPIPDPAPARCADGITEALALCRSASPILPSTEAAGYLQARGCSLPHPDGDLRFLAAHRHPGGWRGPCLLALVTDAITGEPMTLHRTWVQPDGSKAPIDRPRLLWPGLPKAGGVVRLWPDDEVTLGLCVAEGIETALTAAAGFGMAWSTIDAGNLAALPVLDGIESLTIVADHDPAGKKGADACRRRWLEAGVEVRVWQAPNAGADLNDYARAASC